MSDQKFVLSIQDGVVVEHNIIIISFQEKKIICSPHHNEMLVT